MREVVTLDPDAQVARLLELLERYPDALVVGIDAIGMFTALPPEVPVAGRRTVENADSALDLVVADDQLPVLACWESAVQTGEAAVLARFVDPPHEPVRLIALDVSATYGCFVGLLAPTHPNQAVASPAEHSSRRSRVARLRKDRLGRITAADPAVTTMLGWTEDELLDTRSVDFTHPDDRQLVVAGWLLMLSHPDEPQTHRVRMRHRDGGVVWVEVTHHNHLGEDNQGEVLADLIDISSEMAATEALRQREELLNRLTQALPLGVLQVDAAGAVVFTNDRLHEILERARTETVAAQLASVDPEHRPFVQAALDATLGTGADQDLEVRFVAGDGRELLCRLSMRPLTDDTGAATGAIITVDDVTEQALLHLELHDRATHDALTGTLNRASIMAAVDDALAGHDRSGAGTAAIFIDLDRFKPINDRLGHASGDAVLRAVADRLCEELRDDDAVGRLGGDEFLVLCRSVDHVDDARRVARRIAERLHQSIDADGLAIEIRASIGVTWSAEPGLDPATFVAEADAAMYESKRQGAGEPVIFGPQVHGASLRSFDEERRLRRALANGELAVHYQPIVHLATGATAGFEALLRWYRDDRVVSAGEFIELAEQTGCIHEIGAWVLETVCRDAAEARVAGHDGLIWTANVSPLQIATPGLADHVGACLERFGLEPSSLVLELTEHNLLGAYAAPHQTLEALRALGVRLALDDFGTGWSSFELLRRLPVDCIKIPMPFVADITENPRTAFLVESLVSIAAGLGSFVVAEGVEEREQRDRLVAAGVDLCQGWLYSPALPLPDALRTLPAPATRA